MSEEIRLLRWENIASSHILQNDSILKLETRNEKDESITLRDADDTVTKKKKKLSSISKWEPKNT